MGHGHGTLHMVQCPTICPTQGRGKTLYSAANDPQTGNDPEPQMIPDVDREWSRRKTRNGMEFVPWASRDFNF